MEQASKMSSDPRITIGLVSQMIGTRSYQTKSMRSNHDRLKWKKHCDLSLLFSIYFVLFNFVSLIVPSNGNISRQSRSPLLSPNTNQLDLKFEITENSPAGTLIGVIRSPSGYQPCQPPFLIVPIKSGSSNDRSSSSSFLPSSSSSSSSSLPSSSSSFSQSSSVSSSSRGGVDTDLSIDQASGEIRNSIVFDREEISYYTFIAIPFVGPNIKVTINVLDANDNAPLFPVPSIHLEFPENSKVRDVRRTLPPARDRDLGIFGTQKYRIISGNNGNAFRLVSHREKDDVLYHDLQVNGILDRETTSHYSLIIEALDGGLPPLSSQLLVNISILDVNDNEPIFTQSRYFATVLENATLGTPILQVTATDSDEADNGRIEYLLPANRRSPVSPFSRSSSSSNQNAVSGSSSSSNNGNNGLSGHHQQESNSADSSAYFAINKDTGMVYLARPVDFETKDSHELVIVARDCGLQPLETSAFVSIRVIDVNDNRPTISLLFLTQNAQPSVPEDAKVGDLVARISVNDPDSDGLDSSSNLPEFTVTLTGSDGAFHLNQSDNAIYMVTIARPLDREIKSIYSMTVTVSDSGSPPLTATTTFSLEISDINDNPPYFESSVYYASLPEIADPGTVVYKMKAIDRDSDSQITYAIDKSASNTSSLTWFTIDPSTGLVTTRSQLDCETEPTPRMVITASDGSPVTASATLIVTINDVNDNEPIFDQSFYNVTVREDAAVGSCIIRVSASDPDCGVNSLVNYSSVNMVTLGQSPSGLGLEAKTRDLIITSDFTVNSTTGDLCIARSLDYEKRKSYDIPVMATDRGGLATTAMIKVTLIDVNDNVPIFYPKEYKVSVEENIVPLSKGRSIEPAPIVIVAATDADSPGHPFGTISYSIKSGNEEKAFEIDPSSGRIYIVRPLSSAKPFYQLTIIASDGGNRESLEPAQVHVSVLPQAGQSRSFSPVFSQRHYNFEVRENELPGTRVGSVSASASTSSPVTYAIYSGDPDSYFNIDPNSGIIRVNGRGIDAEKYASLLLNVQAKEGLSPGPYRYGHTQVNITIIDINDNHPTFGTDRLKIAVPENTPPRNVTVLIAQASDADSTTFGNLTYSLQDTQLGPNETPFVINRITGALTLRSPLDFESMSHYRLIVTATDGGGLSSNMAVDVNIQDVNDCVPKFVGLTDGTFRVSLEENAPINTQVYQFRAIDGDTGNNARLTYSLIESTSKGQSDLIDLNPEFPFGIFPNNGILYTRRSLDRESRDNFSLTIQVTDHGSPSPLRSTAPMTIIVLDTNDNRPTFTNKEWTFSISESAVPGTPIGQISATDSDVGENATLRYVIYEGFGLEAIKFSLDQVTGEISLRSSLDRESKDRYIFKVDAIDSGRPTSLSAEIKATVIIDVLDINDNAPSFIADDLPSHAHRQIISLGSPEGTFVTTVKAVDPDFGLNGTITYSLVDSDSDLFVIGKTNGVIKTAQPIDKVSSYRVGVQAIDGGGLRSPIKIIQIDVIQRTGSSSGHSSQPGHRRSQQKPSQENSGNSNSDQLNYFEFQVRESVPIGTEIGTINVALAEMTASFFQRFSYCLNGYFVLNDKTSNPNFDSNFPFAIESSDFASVSLVVTRPLDFEMTSEYAFQIFVDPWQCGLAFTPDQTIQPATTASFRSSATSDINRGFGKNYRPVATVKVTVSDDISDCHPFEAIVRDLKDRNGSIFDLRVPISDETIHQRFINLYPLNEVWSAGCTGLGLSYRLKSLSLEESVLNRLLTVIEDSMLVLRPFDKDILKNLVNSAQLIVIIQAYSNSNDNDQFRSLLGSQAIRLQFIKDSGRNIDRITFSSPSVLTFPEDCCSQGENIVRLSINVSHDDFDVNYRLTEMTDTGSTFSIDSESGLLTLLKPFDAEVVTEYRLNVTASVYQRSASGAGVSSSRSSLSSSSSGITSGRLPLRSASQTFTIFVTNVNDEKPIFLETSYQREILESVSPGTLVASVEAKDDDKNSDLTYLIPSGHVEAKYFSVDSKSGQLKTKANLDREIRETHQIPIYVFDNDYRHSAMTMVTVVLLDVNDNQPVFSSPSQLVKIPESILPGTVFHTLIASDRDTLTGLGNGSASLSSLEYTIINGNDEGKFAINSATGQLSTLSTLDRERRSTYNLTIQVTDSLYRSQCNLIIDLIDVNDNSPIFEKSVYYAVLDETRLGQCDSGQEDGSRDIEVVVVKAIDPDSDNSIYYTIVASGSPEAMYFTIDPSTGLITTDCAALSQARKAKLTSTGIDYATSATRSLTLSFDVFAIDVGSSPYAAHTTKTTIQVTIMKTGDTESIRLASYPTIIEVPGYKEDYKVGSEIGRIPVINNIPSSASSTASVPGSSFKDDSTNPSANSLIYSIVDEDPNSRFSDYYHLDPRTGAITVKRALSYGHNEAFVEIRRNDSPFSTLTLVQVILSGEMMSAQSESNKRARPAIKYTVQLYENVPLGTEVINLMSRYRTSDQPRGSSGLSRSPLFDYQFQLAYSSVNRSAFYLYPNTGIITVRKMLDFEIDPSQMELVVVARKRSSTLSDPIFFQITVNLLNVNDNAPRFTQAHYIATVREGESKGVFVTQISALDVDNVDSSSNSGLFYWNLQGEKRGLSSKPPSGRSTLTYHILEGNYDNAFFIDPPGSGIVKTNIVLDREIRDHYVLTIMANDEGPTGASSALRDSRTLISAQLSSKCTLRINVIDINDNVPVFPPYQEISVSEDAEVGSAVASLTANDVDTFPPLTYYQKRSHLSGLSDDNNDLFDIELYSGRITLKSRLDRPTSGTDLQKPALNRTPAQYKIAVLASDSLNSIETQVVIKVKPKNIYQRSPNFERDHYFVQLEPQTHRCVFSDSVNCKIVQVTTIRSDDSSLTENNSPKLKVSYKLTGSSAKGFYIDAFTGIIYNNRSLSGHSFDKSNPKNGSVFQLTVIAGYTNDAGRFISDHKARAAVLIVVPGGLTASDLGQSREDKTTYTISVSRDSVDETLLEMKDWTERSVYELVNGNIDRTFAIKRGRQLIMVKRPLRSDYKLELIRRSNSSVKIFDSAFDSKSPSIVTVIIKVTSSNSEGNSRAFRSQVLTEFVSETVQPGHDVISVAADDLLNLGETYRFVIYVGNEAQVFRIDESTGMITTNKSLDYESVNFYQLTIVAYKEPGSVQSGFCLVNINIVNENDNRPKFPLTSYKILVNENTPIGSQIIKVTALDADDEIDDSPPQVNYTLIRTIDGLAPFKLDPTTGYIVTTEAIDYESLESDFSSPPTYKIVLKAIESSSSSAEVLIEAQIGSVDEFPPKFKAERYDFKVTTSYGIPQVIVGQISATDGDHGPDGQVIYAIRSSSPPGAAKKFNLNSTTGLITINTATVDKIPPHFSSLIVSASSGRTDSLSSVTRIGVTLILTDDKSSLHVPLNNDISHSGSLYDGTNLVSSPSSPSISGSQVTSLPGWVLFLIVLLVLVTIILLIAIFVIRSHLSGHGTSSASHHHHHGTGHHHQSFMTTSALASIVPGVGTLLRKIGAARGSVGDGLGSNGHIGNTTLDSMNDTSTTYDHASYQGLHHVVGHHHHMGPPYLTPGQHPPPPCYNEVGGLVPSTSQSLNVSSGGGNAEGQSASSGRGSAEEDDPDPADMDEVDEEVRMINEGDGYYSFGLVNPGPPDEHELVPTTAEYLARIGIFDADIAVREDDLDDLAEEVQSKAGSESKSCKESDLYLERKRCRLVTSSLRDRKTSTNSRRTGNKSNPVVEWTDLGCIEEELSDAYSWDYLSNWSPRYQPLASVYTEIAKLKGAIPETPIGRSSSGMSDSPAYLRTASTPRGCGPNSDNDLETASHKSHSTQASRRSGHLAAAVAGNSSHSTRSSKCSLKQYRPPIPTRGSVPFSTHNSAFLPFPSGNANRPTDFGPTCDNRLKGIASDSSSDASTATAVFVDNNSADAD